MPLPALLSAIVSSVVSSAAEEAVTQIIAPPLIMPGPTVPGRVLPQDSLVGRIFVTGPLSAEINGVEVRLAPGIQFRNAANLIVMPTTIQEPTLVRFIVDASGAVSRVWILSPQEAAQLP